MPSAVVVGAAGGIGAALSVALCHRGLTVVGIDTKPTLSVGLETYTHHVLDGGNWEAMEHLFDNALDQRVNHMFVVAGGATQAEVDAEGALSPPSQYSAKTWQTNVETSIVATLVFAQYWEKQRQAERLDSCEDASITLCSSINAVGSFRYPSYSAAKGAVEAIVHSTAAEVARSGIRLNCIRLGTVETPASDRLHRGDPGHFDPLLERSLLGRFTSLQEAVAPFVSVALDLTAVTGAVLTVDCGQSLPGLRHDRERR